MSMHIVRIHEDRWTVSRRPIAPDPLALIRDRELRDLITALDDALDVVIDAVVGPDGCALSACQGERIHDALSTAFNFLVELRRADAR